MGTCLLTIMLSGLTMIFATIGMFVLDGDWFTFAWLAVLQLVIFHICKIIWIKIIWPALGHK